MGSKWLRISYLWNAIISYEDRRTSEFEKVNGQQLKIITKFSSVSITLDIFIISTNKFADGYKLKVINIS